MALVGYYKRSAYCASKGGLNKLTRALAIEWAEDSVLVNSIAPTFIETPFTEKMHVNDSNYGLQAGIYTENVSIALRVADKLHVGGIIINDVPTFRVDQMPYGGVKESGTRREGIKYAIEEMTEIKLVVWNKEY